MMLRKEVSHYQGDFFKKITGNFTSEPMNFLISGIACFSFVLNVDFRDIRCALCPVEVDPVGHRKRYKCGDKYKNWNCRTRRDFVCSPLYSRRPTCLISGT